MQQDSDENFCQLRVPLHDSYAEPTSRDVPRPPSVVRMDHIHHCDIFVGDNHFYISADGKLLKFHSARKFDKHNVKKMIVRFDTRSQSYILKLPCLPPPKTQIVDIIIPKNLGLLDRKLKRDPGTLDRPNNLEGLLRISNLCQLQIDDSPELKSFELDYGHGFGNKYRGPLVQGKSDLTSGIVCIPEPHCTSPLQRMIEREYDEIKIFSREQYKINFVDLQVPDGHTNPTTFTINFTDCVLTTEEEQLLHNLTCKSELNVLPSTSTQKEIDNGLISILLSICYDIRFTSNEPSCESAWLRSTLSPTFCYFEVFDSLREVLVCFLRRCLIFPYYRNYDLARLVVQNLCVALDKHPRWILKQLLITHKIFSTAQENHEIYNRYFMDDYIRYVSNETYCNEIHMKTLSRNLKNVCFDVYKQHLRMDLETIETELFKELIADMNYTASTSGEETDENDEELIANDLGDEEDDEEDEDGDDEDEEDGDEDELDGDGDDEEEDDDEDKGDDSNVTEDEDHSSATETEEDSVIEQCVNAGAM